MAEPANYKQVLSHFASKPDDIRHYFGSFPDLVDRYEWDISVSYVFTRIEAAKHDTLYTGIVKLHWAHAGLTRELLDKDHLSRGRFRELFAKVYGEPIKQAIASKLTAAEAVRDRVVHGKNIKQAEARRGLADAFDFAEEFSDYVVSLGGVRPFGSLQGFKGRAESLTRQTTRWVLLGMDIPPRKQQAG